MTCHESVDAYIYWMFGEEHKETWMMGMLPSIFCFQFFWFRLGSPPFLRMVARRLRSRCAWGTLFVLSSPRMMEIHKTYCYVCAFVGVGLQCSESISFEGICALLWALGLESCDLCRVVPVFALLPNGCQVLVSSWRGQVCLKWNVRNIHW